jgi:hypothetical protein
VIIAAFLLPVVGAFWVFVLWMLWIISKSLRGIDQSLKEIARNHPDKS